MKNLKRKHIYGIILLIWGLYWTYDYFENKKNIKNLNYGIKANDLRKSLNVPIIDGYMSAQYKYDDGFIGNRWESRRDKPKENEILHVWKNANPSDNKSFNLDDEDDGFRKLDNNGKIMQFNIYSTIIGDSISERKGRFFYYDSKPRMEKELNEMEIDSVAKSWNLNYLIKK
ncbi:hypothetical protein [Mangrovimonas sp. YM274]|uniref:hypothetical protein n=1 Tax=Mangrovimonas sp. YM274 TaxID=3070660 RepID=UPI0027DAC154|nr:hypothetical protein [Mangrovimonas sp. YM274]WMI68218.1 hypothetical protein RBH95_13830 [Mangrovimonas sp. YM274]